MRDRWVLALKKIIYYHFNLFDYREKKAIDAVADLTTCDEKTYPNSIYKVGIIKEKWHLHSSYIKACQELQVSYVVIDMFSKHWLEHVTSHSVDFIVARPSVQYAPWKDMFDNRLKLLIRHFDIKIWPNFEALWIWESKLRTLDFLKINHIPHPKSDIYYDKQELLECSKTLNYPTVYKASSGSGASGVKILKTKQQLNQIVKKVFYRGVRSYRKHKLDKEHGYVILQQYLKDVKEWRIVRIGDYFFGFEKLKNGEFHSGSKNFGYGMPPQECLSLVREITATHNFKFVSIDIFITKDNEYLINEIQPYFGQEGDRELLQIDGESGRLYFDDATSAWVFEKGTYCKNNLCNLRLLEMIKLMEP